MQNGEIPILQEPTSGGSDQIVQSPLPQQVFEPPHVGSYKRKQGADPGPVAGMALLFEGFVANFL